MVKDEELLFCDTNSQVDSLILPDNFVDKHKALLDRDILFLMHPTLATNQLRGFTGHLSLSACGLLLKKTS